LSFVAVLGLVKLDWSARPLTLTITITISWREKGAKLGVFPGSPLVGKQLRAGSLRNLQFSSTLTL
jgi:hypothetical protein